MMPLPPRGISARFGTFWLGLPKARATIDSANLTAPTHSKGKSPILDYLRISAGFNRNVRQMLLGWRLVQFSYSGVMMALQASE
jgi:hypothetical protein